MKHLLKSVVLLLSATVAFAANPARVLKRASNTELQGRPVATPAEAAARRNQASEKMELVEVGPHTRTWQIKKGKDAEGQGTLVEIESGMNFRDGDKWVPSKAEFETDGDAFVARRVQHKLRLNAQLNGAAAVTLTTPDGLVLRSTPVAIGLYDPGTGQSKILAEVQDSIAAKIAPNQVLYENAFSNDDIVASVLYTVEKGSFEQDIIIHSKVDPEIHGFPKDTAQIQVFTEFFDPPQPERTRRPLRVEANEKQRGKMKDPDLIDETLRFGEFELPTGRAFATGHNRSSADASAPVAKAFKAINGKHYLVETVDYKGVSEKLDRLPRSRASKSSSPRIPAGELVPPTRTARFRSGAEPQLALASNFHQRKGFVIDYLGVAGAATTVFRADTTYLVRGTVTLSSAVIEGGAVFKYRNSTGSNPMPSCLKINGTLTSKATQYAPIIFTGVDDDSIGEWFPQTITVEENNQQVSYETGKYFDGTVFGSLTEPGPDMQWNTQDDVRRYYGDPYLWLNYVAYPTIRHMRFLYAKEAVRLEGNFNTYGATVAHSQFVTCMKGVVITGTGGSSGTATPLIVENSLLSNVANPFTFNIYLGMQSVATHVTIDGATAVATTSPTVSTSMRFVNSIFANISALPPSTISLSGNNNGFYNYTSSQNPTYFGVSSTRYTTTTSPFEQVGDGRYYLARSHSFLGKGTASISSTLLADLKKRTTKSPLYIKYPSGVFNGETYWTPTAPRYVSGAPDLGFYYDPIDYLVNTVVVEDSYLSVSGGAVIAYIPDTFLNWIGREVVGEIGLILFGDTVLESVGTPTTMNRFVTAEVVQEGSNPVAIDTIGYVNITFEASDTLPFPSAFFRFTDFSVLSGYNTYHVATGWDNLDGQVVWSDGGVGELAFVDCQIRSGRITLSRYVDGWTQDMYDYAQIYRARNSLFERTFFWSMIDVGKIFEVRNNLFKNADLLWDQAGSVPADWTITDNLFDGVKLLAFGDTANDYNVYYNTSSRFAPNGANDTLMSAAPSYQSSTLGNYYLPFTTSNRPLFKGSVSPAAAQLYHYTSRTTQIKDGQETYSTADADLVDKVNIGLHYIALTSLKPRDTDADGIPDYLEDPNGNNVVDPGETSPGDSDTTPNVPDPQNPAYADVDLEGDGLLGRGESALSKNPTVADNPLTIVQVTSGQEPTVLAFVVPVSFSSINAIGRLQLNVNGTVAPLQRVEADSSGNCKIFWDTTHFPAGDQLLQVELRVSELPGGKGETIRVATAGNSLPFFYSILPSDPWWAETPVEDRIAGTSLPQEWLDTASSWQIFCSAIANPYFGVLWAPGTSLSSSYQAARNSPTLAILPTVDSDPALGSNALRFLGSADPAALLTLPECPDEDPCLLDYLLVSHMASFNSALNGLNQTSLNRLFRLAVWDANTLLSMSEHEAAAPAILLAYAAHAKLSPPPSGVSLTPLNASQSAALDIGSVPDDVASAISSAKSSLGLTSRP